MVLDFAISKCHNVLRRSNGNTDNSKCNFLHISTMEYLSYLASYSMPALYLQSKSSRQESCAASTPLLKTSPPSKHNNASSCCQQARFPSENFFFKSRRIASNSMKKKKCTLMCGRSSSPSVLLTSVEVGFHCTW